MAIEVSSKVVYKGSWTCKPNWMFLVSKHCQILLHFYILYSCNKNWRRKKPVPQTSQTLNLASKKYNLRKADGLKLYRNWMFFSFKNSSAKKKISQNLRCGDHHQK